MHNVADARQKVTAGRVGMSNAGVVYRHYYRFALSPLKRLLCIPTEYHTRYCRTPTYFVNYCYCCVLLQFTHCCRAQGAGYRTMWLVSTPGRFVLSRVPIILWRRSLGPTASWERTPTVKALVCRRVILYCTNFVNKWVLTLVVIFIWIQVVQFIIRLQITLQLKRKSR